MSQSVTSSLYVKLVADAGDWESGMAAATSATQKFEAAAKKAARSPGLQSSIGSGEQAQIRKALELRQRYAGMGGDVAGPVRVTDKMVSDESERIILNRLVRSRNAEEQRAATASAASNHIIMVQKSEAEAFALSERKKELAISLVNQAIANASELERQQALVTANATAQTEAKKQAAIEQTAAVNARISEAMALQRGQVLAGMTAPSGNRINPQTSMLVQQAELEAKVIQETEAKKQAAIEQTAKVAAINAKIAAASSASRFENANPFAQQVLATQRLNTLLAQRKTLTDEVDRAQNRLAITEQVADVRSIRANLTAGSTVNRLRNLGSTAADNTGKYARFGVVMQQAGYQIQDFAVQVAGGQNALVAFSQQGSQLLGVFGVGGAIAGAVLSAGILASRMMDLNTGIKEEKSTVDSLAESYRNLDNARNPESSKKFADLESRNAKKEYDDQIALIKNLQNELNKFQSPASRKEQRANAAIPGYSAGIANMESSLISKIADESARLNVIQEKVNKTAIPVVEESRRRFELVADTVAAESKANAEADSRYMAARKENRLMEMSNEEKLNYYLSEMKFLDSIGAKKTEEYEVAKKRTRELGTILIGESGPKEIKTLDQYNKTVAGLQSKVPESLGLNQGALSSGLLVGGASPSALIDISQQILTGIRQLVNIEYMGQRSY